MTDDRSASSREASEEPDGDDFTLSSTAPNTPRTTHSFNSTTSAQPPRHHRKHVSWIQYWASITPLVCGGLGPTLTLMALSGCADHWRTEDLADGRILVERDPAWVVAATAVAIVIGFIANIFLLMRMLGRANPKYMQYLCIIMWSIESIINFVTIGVYVQIEGDDGDWTYAQGFWMTVSSAAMSTICAVLMLFNSWILPPFGKRGTMGLTGPQRVFVIQIMLFIFWLAIGAAMFYGIEGFTFSESVYFVDVTVTTVGFGDNVVPNTNLGRALVMPYAIVGIISLGLVITSIRTIVTEKSHVRRRLVALLMRRYENRVDKLKKRIRRRHASLMGVSMMVMGNHVQRIHEESCRPYFEAIDREERRKKVLESSERWTEIWSLIFVTFVFTVFWVCGAAIFSEMEGWTYFDGLYFCMIFFLTIGYGDFVVTTNAGRAVYIVYSLFTIPIMTILISLMSDTFLSRFQKRAERFGLKGGEDQRYSDLLKKGRMFEGRIKRLFRRQPRTPTEEAKDLESGQAQTSTGEEILRNEILDEVEAIEETAEEEIPEMDEKLPSIVSKEVDEETVEGESSDESSTRQRKSKKAKGKELDGIDEEDVERAIMENRGEADEHED